MQSDSSKTRARSFQVGPLLGRGGFGEVYKARMIQPGGLSSTVVLKVLLPGLVGSGQSIERLRDEGRLLAALEHPAILRAVDITVLGGWVTLVTEFVDGQDLDRCCEGEEPIGPRALVQVIGEVASALDAAWSTPVGETGEPLRLVHRDIKPSNIRVGKHGQVKLLDFGIARSDAMTREAQTADQTLVGSLHFMAPERFTEAIPRPEGDVYSLGCCLFLGLTNRVLFPKLDGPRALRMALDPRFYAAQLAESLTALPQDLNDEVRQLLVACLSHAGKERPSPDEIVSQCDLLSTALGGDSLKAWARQRSWPEIVERAGPLAGKIFTETLSEERVLHEGESHRLAAVDQTWPEMEAPPRRQRRWLPVLATLAVIVGVGFLMPSIGPSDAEPPSPTPMPATTAPARAPSPEPAVAPPEAEPLPERAPAPSAVPPRSTEPARAAAVERDQPVAAAPRSEEPTVSIVFASQPLGAQVHLDGQSIGVTPLMDHPVQVGEHTLGFTLGSEQMESVITVGPRHPTRHFWRVGDRIEASY